MTRREERIKYTQTFKGKDVENEELKDIIRLAILDGAIWADNSLMDKISLYIKDNFRNYGLTPSSMKCLIEDLNENILNN